MRHSHWSVVIRVPAEKHMLDIIVLITLSVKYIEADEKLLVSA